MKENIVGIVCLIIFMFFIYIIASGFRIDSTPRGVPSDMTGYCTNYGDCY